MKNYPPTAFVAGASSGIGEATAYRLALAGYTVYGTSRRGTATDALPITTLSLDVTSDASVSAAVEEVIRRHGRIDVLVNNAGFGVAPGGAEESSMEQARAIFDANFVQPDSKIDAYRNPREIVNKRVKEVMETAEPPPVVAEVLLQVARAARPKLHYTAGVLARRLRLRRTFAPAGVMDAGISKDLRLDTARQGEAA